MAEIQYGTGAQETMTQYGAQAPGKTKLIVIHGGGFAVGDRGGEFGQLAQKAAVAGYDAYSIDYPTIPGATNPQTFPAPSPATETWSDIDLSMSRLAAWIGESAVVIIGHSSGASVGALLAFHLGPSCRAFIGVSGVYDFREGQPHSVEMLAGPNGQTAGKLLDLLLGGDRATMGEVPWFKSPIRLLTHGMKVKLIAAQDDNTIIYGQTTFGASHLGVPSDIRPSGGHNIIKADAFQNELIAWVQANVAVTGEPIPDDVPPPQPAHAHIDFHLFHPQGWPTEFWVQKGKWTGPVPATPQFPVGAFTNNTLWMELQPALRTLVDADGAFVPNAATTARQFGLALANARPGVDIITDLEFVNDGPALGQQGHLPGWSLPWAWQQGAVKFAQALEVEYSFASAFAKRNAGYHWMRAKLNDPAWADYWAAIAPLVGMSRMVVYPEGTRIDWEWLAENMPECGRVVIEFTPRASKWRSADGAFKPLQTPEGLQAKFEAFITDFNAMGRPDLHLTFACWPQFLVGIEGQPSSVKVPDLELGSAIVPLLSAASQPWMPAAF